MLYNQDNENGRAKGIFLRASRTPLVSTKDTTFTALPYKTPNFEECFEIEAILGAGQLVITEKTTHGRLAFLPSQFATNVAPNAFYMWNESADLVTFIRFHAWADGKPSFSFAYACLDIEGVGPLS